MLDPKVPHRVEIPFAPGIAYLLRVPSVMDRARYRHALVAAGARRHGPQALAAELRRGVEAVLAGDELAAPRDALLAEIDGLAAEFAAAIALVGQGDDAALAEAWQQVTARERSVEVLAVAVRDGHPPYAAMLADNAVYWPMAGLVAARHFLLGWEGLPGQPARTAQQTVPDDDLARIPEGHLPLIAQGFEALLAPSEAQAKN